MPEPITQQELDELRALEQAATPGPSELVCPGYDGDNWICCHHSDMMGDFVLDPAPFQNPDSPDLAFILAARTALPRLLDEVERSEEGEREVVPPAPPQGRSPPPGASAVRGDRGDGCGVQPGGGAPEGTARTAGASAPLHFDRDDEATCWYCHSELPREPNDADCPWWVAKQYVDDAEEHEVFLAAQECGVA